MTDNTQPEALRLADAIDPFERKSAPDHLTSKVAADELRRLHAEKERLAALVDAQQPAPSAAPAVSDEDEALDLLAALFDAWENGTPCYEEPESSDGFLGHAFSLDDEVFHRCADLLNRRRGKQPSPTPQADSQPASDERDDFEKVFPLPSGCIRVGTGYASTGYSNWAAHTHCERFQGWKARAARAAPQPAVAAGWVMVPVDPTPEMCAVASIDEGARITDGPVFAAYLYSAMLAASPPTPFSDKGVAHG